MGKLFINAMNVHQGGGRALLVALLSDLPSTTKSVALLDSRLLISAPSSDTVYIKRVRPSVITRLQAEWWLTKNVRSGDTVLCFGNLPPVFKLAGRVVVFVQNKYLLENTSLSGFSWKTKFRLTLERFWFGLKAKNADQFVVQTLSMKTALQLRLGLTDNLNSGNEKPVDILPFTNDVIGYQRKLLVKPNVKLNDYDFIYVASGEPHKNHRTLIEAWCLLAKDHCFPSLCLTLDRAHFPDLCELIDLKISQFILNIENIGVLSHDKVLVLYTVAGALVYPSTFESFGLPLIEARQAGLPVLASELDYVRDVLDPEGSFDPSSAISIARAIKRFMGIEEPPLPLLDAKGFLNQILIG
ncbi:MAG: glycosyltransferase family 4 protein [Rhodoferax sp.]|uniref:glycosyltransferase n=1 Tax=Rhodoferax sp. TaxID=50421 RepID=UPI0013FFB43A|nr:glycosyltransferase [Rhodoferax sp.]NDP39361.1 glycosyltransferase family 4 protein [Rhodoferax sp.]